MNKQYITVLGSTGSVGKSALEIVRLHPDKYSVFALSANTNIDTLLQQCQQFNPQYVALSQADVAESFQNKATALGLQVEVLSGERALEDLASDARANQVISAIVGAVGLLPTLAAIQAGKQVLIANKEPLVMTGALFLQEAKNSGAKIIPVDSEHNAIFQCLPNGEIDSSVKKLHLTASGGPFVGKRWDDLHDISPKQACAHPNWTMGQKISVDSATMMNKGLELIEAAALYSVKRDKLGVVVHPQSIVHSFVEYVDGSFLAQLGAPDMKIPLAHAMAWPERIDSGVKSLDLTQMGTLEFFQPDMPNLPCLRLAQEALDVGGAAPAVLNAANEVAVAAFLQKNIRFTDIPIVIERVLDEHSTAHVKSVAEILLIDNAARRLALSAVKSVN